MRKLISALLMLLLHAQSACSYSIITDSNLFYSFFTQPHKIIEFNQLKDGTSFAQVHNSLEQNITHLANLDCLGPRKGDYGIKRPPSSQMHFQMSGHFWLRFLTDLKIFVGLSCGLIRGFLQAPIKSLLLLPQENPNRSFYIQIRAFWELFRIIQKKQFSFLTDFQPSSVSRLNLLRLQQSMIQIDHMLLK